MRIEDEFDVINRRVVLVANRGLVNEVRYPITYEVHVSWIYNPNMREAITKQIERLAQP